MVRAPARPPRPPRAPRPLPSPPAAAEAGIPDGWIACPVGDRLDGRPRVRVSAVSSEGGEVSWVPLEWRITDGLLAFAPPPPGASVELAWRGGRSPVQIAGRTCTVLAPPAPRDAAVFGRVRGAERLADGTVFLEGCGVDRDGEAAAIDQDGGFYFPAEAGPCRLRAWRRHGALRLPGEWVEIEPASGGEVDVALDVPTFAPAGMGIGFRPASDGVVVETVHPGTPAHEAGLEPGDVITAINGEPTDGMGTEDFLHEGIGPAGTEVDLEGFTSDGEPFESRFLRREILLQ